MQLWGSLYKPDVAILPISANRDAQDVAHMVRLLRTDNPNLKTIIPHHHRLKPPPGAPTPADLANALKEAGLPVAVLDPELSRSYDLTR
jgi:L-ascorbate metabolism protein UlaG (beta-lactamase superfamily)